MNISKNKNHHNISLHNNQINFHLKLLTDTWRWSPQASVPSSDAVSCIESGRSRPLSKLQSAGQSCLWVVWGSILVWRCGSLVEPWQCKEVETGQFWCRGAVSCRSWLWIVLVWISVGRCGSLVVQWWCRGVETWQLRCLGVASGRSLLSVVWVSILV